MRRRTGIEPARGLVTPSTVLKTARSSSPVFREGPNSPADVGSWGRFLIREIRRIPPGGAACGTTDGTSA